MKKSKKPIIYLGLDTETAITVIKKLRKLEYKNSAYILGWCECFDLETWEPTKDKLKYCLRDWDQNNYKHNQPWESFLNRLVELSKTHKIKLLIHNAAYDLGVLLTDGLLKSNYLLNTQKPNIHYYVDEKEKFIAFTYSSQRIKFQIIDTAKFGGYSLNFWLEKLGAKKGVINYSKYNLSVEGEGKNIKLDFFNYLNHKTLELENKQRILMTSELDYLANDVVYLPKIFWLQREIMRTMAKFANIDLNEHWEDLIKSRTIGSICKKTIDIMLNGNFNNYFKPLAKNKEEYEEFKRSNTGGFTFFNKEHLKEICEDEIISCWDINSAYAAVMVDGLPFGPMLKIPSPHWKNYVKFVRIIIYGSKIEWIDELNWISTSAIPNKNDVFDAAQIKRKFIKDGHFRGNKSIEEIDELLNLDSQLNNEIIFNQTIIKTDSYYKLFKGLIKNKIEVVSYFYQEKSEILTDFFKKIYEKKKQAKLEGDFLTELTAKLILNNAYGKFGEQTYENLKFYDVDWKVGYKGVKGKDKLQRLIPCGIYITDTNRERLTRWVLSEFKQGNIILNVDTDSIKMKQLKTPLFEVGNELGQFKHEGNYKIYLCGGKKKKYFLGNDLKEFNLKTDILKMGGVNETFTKSIKKCSMEVLYALFNEKNNVHLLSGKTNWKKNQGDDKQIIPIVTDIAFNAALSFHTHTAQIINGRLTLKNSKYL